ncbi:MAG: hypothetical protein AAFW46_00225 [Pseudomonadota bacterium]
MDFQNVAWAEIDAPDLHRLFEAGVPEPRRARASTTGPVAPLHPRFASSEVAETISGAARRALGATPAVRRVRRRR